MGSTCSCCNGEQEYAGIRNMDVGITNERWIQAVQNDSVVGCRYVHMQDPDVIDQVVDIKTGDHAIHVAVRNRNQQLVEYLGVNNVDVDCQSADKLDTALHIAARINDVGMIKLLLSYGADPDIKNKDKKLARDLCNKSIRREFNKSKVQKLRRLGPPKPERTTSKRDDIFIGGQSINQVNLKTLKKINHAVDTETEGAKRARIKKEEINNRGDEFVTIFGAKVGCEVDEMALFIEKMDQESRKELWGKILKAKSTTSMLDVKKLVFAIAYTVVKKRAAEKTKGKSVKISKPDSRQIERLVSVLRKKFPRENNKKVLTRNDFIKRLHIWLYEIHDDDEWKDGTN